MLGIGGGVCGRDACVKKTAISRSDMGKPFSSACGGEHRARSDSEMLFPLSKNMKGGIPYSGTLLLSLATEKEERNENTQTETRPQTLASLNLNRT